MSLDAVGAFFVEDACSVATGVVVATSVGAGLLSGPAIAAALRSRRFLRGGLLICGAATALLRCQVMDPNDGPVGRAFTGAAVELALASYPGFVTTSLPTPATAFGIFSPAYVEQQIVPHRVHLDDGTVIEVPPPARTETPASTPSAPNVDSVVHTLNTSSLPLGTIAYARSGDKGGDANVGVWIPATAPNGQAAYAWLCELLTPGGVRALLPEAAVLDIDVWVLPNLRAINVVIHGLLGEGVAASTRSDPQAKALGEWLRARLVDIPKELIA